MNCPEAFATWSRRHSVCRVENVFGKYSDLPESCSGASVASYGFLISLTFCAAGSFAPVASAAESNRHSSGSLVTMAGRVGRTSDARNVSLEFVAPRSGGSAVANMESTLAPRLTGSGATRVESTASAGATRPSVNLEAVVNARGSLAANAPRHRGPSRSAPLAPTPQMALGWTDAVARSNSTVGSPLTRASYSPHEAIVPAAGGIGLPQRASVFSAAAVVEPVSHPTSALGNSRLDFTSEPAGNSFQPLASPQQGASGLMGRMR